MSDIGKLVEDVIRRRLALNLRRLVFKRKSKTFYRHVGSSVQVINVQSSSGNIGLSGKFTVNLGVYLPAVAARLGSATDDPWPKEYQCTLRKRIGSLMPSIDDFWWHLDSSTDLDHLASDVASTVIGLGIPWLDAAVDPSRQLAVAESSAYHLEVAAVALELGQPEVAQLRVEAALAERPVAAAYVQRFAKRNQIPLQQL